MGRFRRTTSDHVATRIQSSTVRQSEIQFKQMVYDTYRSYRMEIRNRNFRIFFFINYIQPVSYHLDAVADPYLQMRGGGGGGGGGRSSRPWDKAGGPVSKKLFRFGLKIRGGPGAPLDLPLRG